MAKKQKQNQCECGSGQEYDNCCGLYHTGAKPAPTAAALMRSRYTAYCHQNEPYLLASWHAETRPDSLDLEQDKGKWIGLKLIRTELGEPGDKTGLVEFVARYKVDGKAFRLHEVSQFVFADERWYYYAGELEQKQ